MFCSNCGAENSADAGSCIQCGQALGSIATAAAPPPPAQPGVASAPARHPELRTLLGVSSSPIEWGAGAAFLAASILSSPATLFLVRLGHGGLPPLSQLWISISAELLFAGTALAAFRWVRSDAGAAALAAIAYTVLEALNRLVIVQLFFRGPQWTPIFLFSSVLATFLFLLLLALAVRFIRPIPLGLWVGAMAAHLASSPLYRLASFLYLRAHSYSSFPLFPGAWEVASWLLGATVFTLVFWGGLALFAPKVLRD